MRKFVTVGSLIALAIAMIGVGNVVRSRLESTSSPDTAVAARTKFDPATFEGYPLYSLGPDFRGKPLVAVQHELTGATPHNPSLEIVTYIYGDCEIVQPRTSCAPPLEVLVMPACSPTVDPAELRSNLTVRGAPASAYGDAGHLAINAGGSRIVIIANEPNATADGTALDAAASLVGDNALAGGISASSPLTTVAPSAAACP